MSQKRELFYHVPGLTNLMTYLMLLVEQPPPDSLQHMEDTEEAGLRADVTEGVAFAPAVVL